MKLGKFLNEHWGTFWQVIAGLVVVGVIVVLSGGDWGWALIGIPIFAFVVGYFFKSKYMKKQKK